MTRRAARDAVAQIIEGAMNRRVPPRRVPLVSFGGDISEESAAERILRLGGEAPRKKRRRSVIEPVIVGDDDDDDGYVAKRNEAIIEETVAAFAQRGQARRRHTRWSQSGTLTTGGATAAVNMQADLSALDNTYVTIAFGVVPPTNGGGFYATATITASVNGNPIVRQVSVANSTEISIPGEAVNIRVVDSTPASINNANQTYTVTVTVVPGTRAPLVPAILHDATSAANGPYVINASGNVTVSVPLGVGVVGAIVAAVGAQASQVPTVQIQELAGSVVAYETAIITGQAQSQTLNLTPGTTALKVLNMDAANAVKFSVIWIIQG